MPTFKELFAGYTPQQFASPSRIDRHFSEMFKQAGYEPPKQEEQPKEEVSSWDMALNAAKDSALAALNAGTFFLPDGSLGLVGGTGAEIVGNALQTLGDPNKTLAAKYNPSIASGLTSAGNLAQDVADKAIEYGQGRVNPRDNDTYTGSARNAYDSGFLNVYSGLASMAHADKSASALDKATQSLTDETPVDPAFSLNYLLSPHGLTRSAANILGSMGAIMPSMAIAPESATVGVGNAITRALINRGLYGAAKKFAPRGAEIVRYSMTSPWVEGASEGGFARRDALEQGLSEDEATKRSIYTMGANVPALMASNFAEGLLLGLPFLNSSGSVAQKVVEAGIRQQLNSAQQAIEEGTQRGIQNWQAGRDYSFIPRNYAPDQSQEAWEAYFGSLPLGIAPAVSHVASNRNISEEDRKKREAWERGSQDNLSPDAYAKRARYAATMLSENPNYRTKIRRQSQDDATKERYARYRDWARDKTANQMSDEAFNLIVQAANKYGVPVDHALATAFAESDGNPNIEDSPAGAIGIMQLMPGTAAGLGVDPRNLAQNIDGGVRYLKQMYDETGDWTLAHAAYNAGLGNVQDAGGVPNFKETQNYVARIDGYLRDVDNTGYSNQKNNNILGVENYNMPTQSSRIDNQVASLKDGWQTVIPQIGGVLREKFGINAEISSAARSAEHNAEVGGVPTSYHIIRDNGGDALDIVFDRETSQEEQDAIADYFRNTGLFSEVLYHDVGSGAHLHLGGLKTENLGVQGRADQLYNQRITEGVQRESKPKEPMNPLFDMNPDDSTVKKFIERFARMQRATSEGEQAAEDSLFFEPMFDDKDRFKNTKANRAAITKQYGDEFNTWLQNQLQPQETQPAQPQSPKTEQPTLPAPTQSQEIQTVQPTTQQEPPQQAPPQYVTTTQVQQPQPVLALPPPTPPQQQEQPSQPQQDPVTKNQPPQNILTSNPERKQEILQGLNDGTIDPVAVFNNGDIINHDTLDRDLTDESSNIRKFLDTHDVITDKNGNLIAIKPKEKTTESATPQQSTPMQQQEKSSATPKESPFGIVPPLKTTESQNDASKEEQPTPIPTKEQPEQSAQPETHNKETKPPERKSKQQQKKDALHAKLETDKNPYLKSWLDGKIKEASTPEGKEAREILEDLQKEEYTSEELASWNDRLNNEAITEGFLQKESQKQLEAGEQSIQPTTQLRQQEIAQPEQPTQPQQQEQIYTGTFKELGVAKSFEDLQTLLKQDFPNRNLIINSDSSISDSETGEKTNLYAYQRGRRFKYGSYDTPSGHPFSDDELIEEAHKRYKTDKYPNLKKRVDNLAEDLKSTEQLGGRISVRGLARDSLLEIIAGPEDPETEVIEERPYTDEELAKYDIWMAEKLENDKKLMALTEAELTPQETQSEPQTQSSQEILPVTSEQNEKELSEPVKGKQDEERKPSLENDEKEIVENGQRESGESEGTTGRHQNGESPLRPPVAEGTREKGSTEISGRDSGQQRQDAGELGEDITGTNAENERPVREDKTGRTSTRPSDGNGVRGDSGAVQSNVLKDTQPANQKDKSNNKESRPATTHESAGHNFHITPESGIGEGGLKTKFQQNIEAIKLLKQIETEGRMATPSEQAILAKFNGWGTVASVFSDNQHWQKEQEQLKELLTPEEYSAARAAMTNAFYTSPEIAEKIWSGVERLGFKGGRVLDPSTGSGIFFGTMPSELASKSTLVGVELDDLTGRIAKQLYQKADIEITGFQNRVLPNNYFDLAISNVPFGNVTILEDPSYRKEKFVLHDFFFAKAMDKVRPGGLVVFITSSGTLTSPQKLYSRLSKQADLIAAFKLPNNAFDKNAGTQVTTDIVIFQKRSDARLPSELAQDWGRTTSTWVRDEKTRDTYYGDINVYFDEHPDHMIGKLAPDKLYQNGRRLALDGEGRNIAKELGELMNNLPENILPPLTNNATSPPSSKIILTPPSTQLDGTFSAKDGKIYQRRGNELVEITGKETEPTRDYLHLLGTLDSLLKAQLDPSTTDERLSALRKLLNQKYDDFVKKHGYLNATKNVTRFNADPNFGRVSAIEKYHEDKKAKKTSASKADIFFKRTTGAIKEPTSASTPVDGLSLSLAMRGRVDMGYISDLTGKSEAEIAKQLGDMIYKNPNTNQYELAEEYLSGNVREKLARAKEAARTNPEFMRNIKALEKVQPVDFTENDVSPHLGATWIEPEYYEDFIKYLLNNNVYDVEVSYSGATGAWSVSGRTGYGQENYKWAVSGTKWNLLSLLEAALNKKSPTVTKDKKLDETKTAEAREKVEQLKSEFEKWIWSDEGRKKDLLETYNVEFNSEHLRTYDGSHLVFPGLAQYVKERLYPHQRDVIWRILQGKNTLLAHCVGAGKTWEMQIAAMEMKRLGLIKKPLFVVPPNILKQFEREFYAAYPSAKLLVLTAADLSAPKINISFDEKADTTGRKKTAESAVKTDSKESLAQRQGRLLARRQSLSKIATGNWDGIIISHDMFIRLPMSPETYNEFYREQKALLTAEKKASYGSKAGDKKHQKLLENALSALEQRLARDINEEKKEIVIPFEELGIDQIFVDEADMFKNLGFNTHYNSSIGEYVSGINTSNAQRSLDMYIKTRWLTKLRNGGGVVFATGTPISNTLNEIYTMQRYLDYQTLQEHKIHQFDNWAGVFAKEVKSMEAAPSGNGFREVTRLKLTNLQSLIGMFLKIADVKMPENLPHLKRPKLKNDTRTVVQIEPSNAFKEFKKELLKRAQDIRDRKVTPEEDNYLKIVSDFRKASLDMRLIDPSISESEAGAKIDAICSTVVAKYKETDSVQGAQLIFSDLSVPKSKDINSENVSDEQAALDETVSMDDTSVYEKIKQGLNKRGIPLAQIAFVHEAKNPKQRQALFDRVNNGEIRVILGSTSKMGAGTNFQKHLVALHHLDCPWRPRDIEQREGRILRNGNENSEVEIFTYVTKGSYDANMWEKVSIKQSMIDSVMRGDTTLKELDDVSEISASYEDIASTAYENPLMSEEAKLSAQLRRLQFAKNLFNKSKRDNTKKQKDLSVGIPQVEQQIRNLQADVANKTDTNGDAFRMKIGGTEYTKRAEAAKAFDELVQNFEKTTTTKVGEIGGFDINLRAEHTTALRGGVLETISTRIFAQLSKRGIYGVEPSLKSIEHFISHGGIEKELSRAETTLKKLQGELSAVENEIAKPFPKQAELDETKKQLEEVRAQIAGNQSQNQEEISSDTELEKPLQPAKQSKRGSDVDTRIDNFVEDKDLTPQQQLLKSFGKTLGVKTIFFRNADARFHGAHDGNTTYINVNSETPLSKVFWHESLHWLKANNPELYKALVKAASITDVQRQAYIKETGRTDLKTKEEIDEEILADQFEDAAKRTGLFQSIAGKNRGLIQRVIQWLKDTMNKFIDHFRNPDGKLTTKQAQAFADEFGRIANQLKDPNGNKIFRYNRRTRNIELADGRKVEDFSFDEKETRKNIVRAEREGTIKYSEGTNDNSNKVKQWFSDIADKFSKAIGVDSDKVITTEAQRKKSDQPQDKQTLGLVESIFASPSRIAKRVRVFRAFFNMGDRAMDKLVKLRDEYSAHYKQAMDLVKNDNDREHLFSLLWAGDETQQEFGELSTEEIEEIKAANPDNTSKAIQQAKVDKICKEQEVSENVAKAYVAIRRMLNKIYHLLDEAHRRPIEQSKYLTENQIKALREDKFVDHSSIKVSKSPARAGRRLTHWIEYKTTERYEKINQEVLDRYEADDAIQVLSKEQLEDGRYEVKIRECIPPLTKFKGYIPHFFHTYRVVIKNAQGEQEREIIGSGRTEREAIKIAEDWLKNNTLKEGSKLYISPRAFDVESELGMSKNFAPVMGDRDFGIMMSKVAKSNDITVDEAKKLIGGSVKLKNRHRFLGQLQERKGYKNYERDMDWLLRHHFNTSARYIALETEFKPKAISLFERVFGAYDKDYSKNSLAQYTKNYIDDVNGVPSALEEAVNKALNATRVWQRFVAPFVGNERGLLTLTNSITGRIAYLKLGMFNISSALLNFTQLINAAGYVGWGGLMKHFKSVLARKGKLTLEETKILQASGAAQDIGLDTASGYDKNRYESFAIPVLDWVGNNSMILFKHCDSVCRISTALAAYDKAIAEGKSKAEALNYAKETNRNANFSYGIEDAPNLFRRANPLGKFGLQFMKYSFKQLEVIGDFLPNSEKTTFRQKASFWLPYLLICGLNGIPFLDWLDDFFGEKFSLFPKDFLQKLCIKGAPEIFGDTLGKAIGKIAMYGAPSLLGVDVSKRAGLATITLPDLGGATASTIYDTGVNLAQGNGLNALRSVSPGLYNWVAAGLGETHDSRGRKLSVYENLQDRLIRGIGFNTFEETYLKDIHRIKNNEQRKVTKEEHRAIDDYIDNPTSENLKRLKELKISPARVKEERKKKKQNSLERFQDTIPKKRQKDSAYLFNLLD